MLELATFDHSFLNQSPQKGIRRDWMKLAFAIFLVAILNAVSAQTGMERVQAAFSHLCTGATSLLPVASMTMIVFSGVVYAGGQLLGAETRARANVWATAALTGPLIALLIFAIAPPLLSQIYNDVEGSVSCAGVA